ncbi:unnamed protein product [Cuscuta epithymum]|uniref:Aluminum-activated malate transporter n=2 Tax=Cuscuta epithymum TaxID=186058 RepID=A0AAV0CBF6_9ASTE|nr:unnamed protein product [Cuscuta epithymum]
MEMESSSKNGFRGIPRTVKEKVMGITKNVTKMGKDDPRKVMHCLKVGLALTLNSLVYYYKPLYDSFGQSGIWAVLTVVVVFEFTVGATISKSFNRGSATLLAVCLGTGVVHMAKLLGREGQPFMLGIVVFIVAAVSTFTRFFPRIKRKYDYGVVIFLLTFSMIVVSGYRAEEILEMTYQRLSTVVIGGSICIIISLVICPVWAGEDLQNLVAGNIDKLANSLEGFENAYFGCEEGNDNGVVIDKGSSKAVFYVNCCKSVLSTQASEESLAIFAWWEMCHVGVFRSTHLLKNYLKVGGLVRQCACQMQTLSTYLTSHDQPQAGIEFGRTIKQPCMLMCMESRKVLKELSSTIKSMTQPSPALQTHLQNTKAAMDDLQAAFQAASTVNARSNLLQILTTLTVASILSDLTNCIHDLASSVQELAEIAHFKKQSLNRGTTTVNPVEEEEDGTVMVAVVVVAASKDSPEIERLDVPKR